MKLKTHTLWSLVALTGTAMSCSLPAQAQAPTATGATARLSVIELRDASLADALELIFKAAGNPSHIIDESAQSVPIPSVTLNNIAWDAAVRNLANSNNFKVSRNGTGTWVIEPRNPLPAEGMMGGEGSPFGPGGPGGNPFINGGRPGGVPGAGARPSGKGGLGAGRGRTLSNQSVRTFSNLQTRGNFGGGRQTANPNEGKDYKIIIVRHIYAGGIAQLFQGSTTIATETFVSPGVLSGGGGFGGGGGGGFGGGGGRGGGGFGGGGFGGGGFGGGGLGGGLGGGFGGGGLGGGGFGGGGFGGGGFGGGGLGGF